MKSTKKNILLFKENYCHPLKIKKSITCGLGFRLDRIYKRRQIIENIFSKNNNETKQKTEKRGYKALLKVSYQRIIN